MSPIPSPRPAATVLVFRPADTGALEVFLVKRHGRAGFMAGAHVFPGGRVDDADATLARTLGASARAHARALWDDGLGEDEAAAFAVGAVRETAEECGLLLARDENGAVASPAAAAEVFAALADGAEFHRELSRRGLVPDVSGLFSVAWWLTPEAEPKRFDTRFFAALAPPGQVAGVDAKEVTEGDWFTPPAAVAAYGRAEIRFAPPTLAVLEDLGSPASMDDVARAVSRPHCCICPVITQDDAGGLVLALPGDPLHSEREPAFPGVRSRIVMDDGGNFVSALVDPS